MQDNIAIYLVIYKVISGSEGGARGAVPPGPSLDLRHYIDTRNWNHAFILFKSREN